MFFSECMRSTLGRMWLSGPLKYDGKSLKKVFHHKSRSMIGAVRSLFGDRFEVKNSLWIPSTESLNNEGNKDDALTTALMEVLIVLYYFHLLNRRPCSRG